MMSGYSGTPLGKKLGVKAGMHAILFDMPANLAEISRFQGFASRTSDLGVGIRDRDYIHIFAREQAVLVSALPTISARLKPDGIFWISWPKKASKVPTDITEDVLRTIFLPHHLVDVKVCAIDDIWSGLKFMWRKEYRANVI